MYIRNSSKFGKTIQIIHPGEYYASISNEIIGTLLGSCVALCLYDRARNISGMNHFMLPGHIENDDIFTDKSARYGINAINSLIQKMYDLGAERQSLSAKIFGGGHVLQTKIKVSTIPVDNIKIAKIMMEIEDIPITHMDVGENYTRKVLLDVTTGKVFLKKMMKEEVQRLVSKREIAFASGRFVHE